MSIKSKVLATAATLTLVGGVIAASTLTASPAKAATASCDNTLDSGNCIDIFNKLFGESFFVDVFRQGAHVGQPIILFRASNNDPALDFSFDFQGSVSQLAGLGLVSPLVTLHYANNVAWEFEYAPFGVDSGLCFGTAAVPFNGEGVTLQPCGFTGKTIWIERNSAFAGVTLKPVTVGGKTIPAGSPCTLGDAFSLAGNCSAFSSLNDGDFTPLISGGTTTFTHPQVLTYPQNGFPTDLPRPQLFTHTLQTFANGTVFTNQEWNADFGQALP
jgi:hypothetical protein